MNRPAKNTVTAIVAVVVTASILGIIAAGQVAIRLIQATNTHH